MECENIVTTLRSYVADRLRVVSVGPKHGCRIQLPIAEPGGDLIAVVVEEVGEDQYRVHDGGHLSGLLFDVGPAGPAAGDRVRVERMAEEAGFTIDPNSGVVAIQCSGAAMAYWSLELGRLVAVIASILPVERPRRRVRRGRPSRVARDVIKELVHERLMQVIHPGLVVSGITDRHFIDLAYTAPPGLGLSERQVFVLTADLAVNNPVGVARRSVVTATDIPGEPPVIRLIHGVGDAGSERDHRDSAEALLRSAEKRGLFDLYSWDEPADRQRFLGTVEQELAPLLASVG